MKLCARIEPMYRRLWIAIAPFVESSGNKDQVYRCPDVLIDRIAQNHDLDSRADNNN